MAIKDEVAKVFRALHITAARDEDRLGQHLGMDSQELVSLTCELESHFHVPIPESDIRESMTVADVAALMSGKLACPQPDAPAPAVARQDSLTEQIVVNAPADEVYKDLLRVEDWPRQLPHVDRIDVIYDDGRYQEFHMTVRAGDRPAIRVRSIRRCGEGEIQFFQPEPPTYLTRHSGGWTFESTGQRQCLVTTRHEWTLSDSAAEVFPETDRETTAAQVERVLRDHARLALSSWKSIIEERRSHDSRTDPDRCPVTAGL